MPEPTELRQDSATRNWIVVAPGRGHRPTVFGRTARAAAAAACPFCPGREAETPAELWRLATADGGWQVRVVPNKYAMLAGHGSGTRHVTAGGFVAMLGFGRYEVVSESPAHDADLARGGTAAVRDALEAYPARYRALRAEGWACVVVFRNHGPGAGTSLAHAHSQLVATPVVPLEIRHRFEVARQHFDDTGTCRYVELLGREMAEGRRIVLTRDRVVAFQPFAAAVPFETWIMPRTHAASFGDASDGDLDDLASALRAVLGGLSHLLGDPDYNLVIQSAPPGDEGRPYFVWHLRIVPRLTTPAGFELGSGMPVNPSLPEETAAELRDAVAREIARAGAQE